MPIEFEHAVWLWGLALAPLVWLLTLRSHAFRSLRARLVCAALRSLILVLAVLAIARPVRTIVKRQETPAAVLFVLDHSLSVQSDKEELARKEEAYGTALQKLCRIERLGFARTVWRSGEPVSSALDGTDIAAGLDRARGELPTGGAGVVLLFSDGRATRGDAVQAANRLRAQGACVYAVPIGKPSRKGPRIVGVEPPSRARLRQPVQFAVRIRSDYESPAEVRLLNAKGIEVDRVKALIQDEGVVVLRHLPEEAGYQNYRVLIADPKDVEGEQTVAWAPIYVEGPPRVLVLDTLPDETERLTSTLMKEMKLQIDVRSCSERPSFESLMSYDEVILSDCAEIDGRLQTDLRRYVEEAGGGLLFIGGTNVRTKQWRGSILERSLPIEFLPEQINVVEKPESVHVCFVLDKSGSMAQPLGPSSGGLVSKIDMVKVAVQRSVAELPASATISVVVFDALTTVLVAAAPLSDWARVSATVDQLAASGGTVMDTAVEKGIQLLAQSPCQRHMILLTDGITNVSTGSPVARWDQLIRSIKDANIRLTTIALGQEADRDLLEKLAWRTGGIREDCTTAEQIPTVFVKEAKTIKQLSRARKAPFTPRAGDAVHMIRGFAIDSCPPLAGSLATKAKAMSQVVLTTDARTPLLALWQRGLGTVTVFTSDAKTTWARQWMTWATFGRFWSQVVAWTLRSANRVQAEVEPVIEGTNVRVLLRVSDEDGKPVEHLAASAVLRPAADANAPATHLTWRETRPSIYEGRGVLAAPGNHLCHLQLRSGNAVVFNHTMLLRAGDLAEMAETGPDLDALGAIASSGGGVVNPTPEQVTQSLSALRQRDVPMTRDYWPFLVLAAILLWPFDVAARRVIQ